MRALSALIFGGDPYRVGPKLVTPEPATLQLNMTEADLSNKNLGVGGAIIISAWLTHKDKGALSHLNLASNGIGKLVLPEGWSEKYGKAAVYGYTHNDGREQKEAPAGSKPEGAIAIANAIKDMGALTKLDISNNNIEQGEALQRIADLCNTKGIELDNHKSKSEGDDGH
jgi:hypothetical protein